MTKKTNNEEISKKNSASKKSAEISKTSKKQTASLKKKTDGQIKKTMAKKTATKKTVEVPKKTVSSSIRKIEPIKTDDIEKKEERESIKLLREAIKAKSKNISKPVSVKKHLIVKDEEIKEDSLIQWSFFAKSGHYFLKKFLTCFSTLKSHFPGIYNLFPLVILHIPKCYIKIVSAFAAF